MNEGKSGGRIFPLSLWEDFNMRRLSLNFKKYLYSILIAFVVFTAQGTARITPLAFKDITKYFEKEKEFYSPTLGITALDSGLIHNLRFYGNFIAAYKEKDGQITDERDYANDNSEDPLWNLIKLLFPSNGGDVSPEAATLDNFGNVVTSPESVALLLQFAHQVRNNRANTGRAIVDEERKISLMEKKEKREERKSLPFKAFESRRLNLTEAQKKFHEDHPDEEITLELDQIKFLEEQLKKKEANKSKTAKKNVREELPPSEKLKEEIYKTLSVDFGKHNIRLRNAIGMIINAIIDSIIQEEGFQEKKSSFYPKYTTEQVILAFFCEKFNTQKDIFDFLRALSALDAAHEIMIPDSVFPTSEEIAKGDTLLKETDLPSIANKKNPNLDDFYGLANADIFTRITPYKPGRSPLSNGKTNAFDRSVDGGKGREITNATFPDCVEITARHICNLLLYNVDEKDFDLTEIKKYMEKSKKDYFANFEKFYDMQRINLANSGSLNIRSLWNHVVGDLNAFDTNPAKIFYIKTNSDNKDKFFEMDSGFINFVNIFRKIFDVKLGEGSNQTEEDTKKLEALNLDTATLDQKKKWIEAYLIAIFKALNPKYTYELQEIKLNETNIRGHNDIFGSPSN